MLQVHSDGPVLRVTLDRPEVRNAFNETLIARLTEVFHDVPDACRAVVLSGNGPGFCAGGDLEWMRRASNYSEEENLRDALKLTRLFKSIVECPAVVIAKIHGAAFGGGCGLVAAADIGIAADDAKFAFSEVKLGLIPATISHFVIPKIGQGNARALFTTGEAFGAEKALRIGLVHEVGAADNLEAEVERKLKNILTCGPKAVRGTKQLINDSPVTLDECAHRLARVRAGSEAKEGVGAFLEKRAAGFVQELQAQ